MTHFYRLIDNLNGMDLFFPGVSAAMSQKLKEGEPVDFSDQDVRDQALLHVSNVSEGNYGERPFLSVSLDLESLIFFGANHKQLHFDLSLIHI